MARPRKDTPDIKDQICSRMAEGESLRSICRDDNFPSVGTVLRWITEDDGGQFREQYAKAKQLGLEALAEDIMEIADDAKNDWMERHGKEDAGWVANGEHIQRSRLRIDSRKWVLSKLLPKKYGEKLELSGDPNAPLVFQKITRTVVDPKA